MAQQNSPFLLQSYLYCEEEVVEEEQWNIINPKTQVLIEEEFLCEDEELSTLLSKEHENELYSRFEENPYLGNARREAIEWILRVTGYYSFSAVSAVLAVNYLDRFLFRFEYSHTEKPWMTQLAAVTCLSLAAKVEETHVPLLLDLQVEESKYVFDAKTIQRMEILALSTLEWKMNPVTPISFLDYIPRKLGLKTYFCRKFIKKCQCLLLSVISDSRFMCYLPSALATAVMLYVISSVESYIGAEYHSQLSGILGINKDKVEDCCRLIQEVITNVEFDLSNKRKFGLFPGSPKGIMDISFTSDSSNDSWAAASTSVSSSPEPLSKKIKNFA